MKSKLLMYFVIFFLVVPNRLDAKKIYQSNQNKAIKKIVDSVNELAWQNRRIYSTGKYYAIKAKKLSDSIAYSAGLSTSLTRLGVIEKIKGNYHDALKYYFESLKIDKANNNFYGIIRAKIQIGRIFHKKKEYDKAIKYSNEALNLALKDVHNKKQIALIYYTIGSIYFDIKSYENSLKFYYKSSKIREEIKDSLGLARDCLDMGNIYSQFNKFDRAMYYFNKSNSLYKKINNKQGLSKVYNGIGINYYKRNKIDSALVFYKKALGYSGNINTMQSTAILHNIGVAYVEKKQLNLAIKYFTKSIELAERQGELSQLVNSYYNLGRLHKKQKQYNLAFIYLNKSLKLSRKNNEDLIRLQILITLAETYESVGEFKLASMYNEQHIVLRDSIDFKYKTLESVEKKYEEEKKNNEINKEKSLRIIAQSKKKTILLYALGIGVFLTISLFLSLFLVYRAKKSKELLEKNQKIELQKKIDLLKKQELKTVKAMINGQESERKRIAQDLHDRLGSMLSVVKLNYKSIEDNLDKLKEENRQQYSQANALLDEACKAVREIAHNMVSGVLTKFGLVAALQDLKNTLKGTNTFELELVTYGLDDRLENNLEFELYGIVQELIHNVIKHAKASEVSVQLLKRANSINLTVIDDGIGFDSFKDLSHQGMGLKGVTSRVNSLNGVIEIDSGKGNGTTINIEIPL